MSDYECWECDPDDPCFHEPPPRKVRTVRVSATFVRQARILSGDRRWPLRAVSDPDE